MLRFQNTFDHSKFRLLVISTAILGLFITSCMNDLNVPESFELEITNLYKSNLDAEIESVEKIIVEKNADGEIEIPVRFITTQSLHHVLFTIDGTDEIWLNTGVVEILSMNGGIAITQGIEEGTILIVNPMPTIRELFNIDSENLRYKFRMGRRFCRM